MLAKVQDDQIRAEKISGFLNISFARVTSVPLALLVRRQPKRPTLEFVSTKFLRVICVVFKDGSR
jgi:hypothetical protein